jgi:hypothetical protein
MIRGLRLIAGLTAALVLSACTSQAAPSGVGSAHSGLDDRTSQNFAVTPDLLNLLRDGSFERPTVPPGGYKDFLSGSSFSKWTVVGTGGDIAIVSGTFTQNGFSFPAGCGIQWVDLTGYGNTGTGVAQTMTTVKGKKYSLRFSVGNVYDPNGIFGTTSTVNVLVNHVQTFSATNSKGAGMMKLVWEGFTTPIIAPSNSTTVTFLNGDPPGDNVDGLDCVKLI